MTEPSEQFTQTVGGGSGQPMRTSATGVVETNNYEEGAVIEVGPNTATAYPHGYNPAETIEELIIIETGTDIVADVVTTSGTPITIPLRGKSPTLNYLSIDSITFRDPTGSGADTYGMWIGE